MRNIRIEIFAEAARAEEIARAIVEAAHTGSKGDGMIVMMPVEKVLRIRTKAEAGPQEI